MVVKKTALGQARIPLIERRRKKKMRFAGVIFSLIGLCVFFVYASMFFSWIHVSAVVFDGNCCVVDVLLASRGGS